MLTLDNLLDNFFVFVYLNSQCFGIYIYITQQCYLKKIDLLKYVTSIFGIMIAYHLSVWIHYTEQESSDRDTV